MAAGLVWVVVAVLAALASPASPASPLSYMMSPANTVTCRDKDKKLLEEVENAQLAAHRFVFFFAE